MRIVRPSGIWNSRAPLHSFWHNSLLLQRDYGILTCSVATARYAIDHNPETSPTRLLNPKGSGPVARKAWTKYREAWRVLSARPNETPDFKGLDNDLAVALYAIREGALVRYAGLFESYVQCWALNMLLARLERGADLDKSQREIAERFSPVGKSHVILPGVPHVLKAFPEVLASLEKMPHITTDPSTGNLVEEAASSELNAYRVVAFWRELRNFIVHRGSRLSAGFVASHMAFFELLRQPYSTKLRPLERGAHIQLPDVMYFAMTTTHAKVAMRLNAILKEASSGRRGCVYLPSEEKEEPGRFDPNLRTLPILVAEDHAESLSWVRLFESVPEEDEDFADEAQPFIPAILRD